MEYIEEINPLEKWRMEFIKKRQEVISRFQLRTPEKIVEFFKYANLKKMVPDFCILFKDNILCHNLPENELVCYFCACPFYDYELWDENRKIFGACKNPEGSGVRNNYGYFDCTSCVLPHQEKTALKMLKEGVEKNEH
ncbi:MAG: hypothetical protein ABIL92_01235 [candidate division WOR-3 bacterium]